MSSLKLSEIVQDQLAKGVPPSAVRSKLQAGGIRWAYSFQSHTGARARTRNLKKLGLKPCEGTECQAGIPIDSPSALCSGCLEAKWGRS